MVAAIVAGDPAGLAAAYERYAAGLHAYCRSLLAEPAGAADAVRDTFIAATARLAHLREPDRLRPWLYAVARNACLRRLRDRALGANPAPALADTGDLTGEPASATAEDERSGPRELVAAAIAALDAGERDAVELNLRHDIDDAGVAATLGLSRHQAHALTTRARKQFEASLSALLVARAGPEFCPDLATLLAGWHGALTDELRRRLGRHIGRCPVCGERKKRKLQSAMLLGLRPLPALPDSVWRQVITLVADTTPLGAAKRAHIAQRAEPFGKSGFPVPIDPPGLARPPARSVLAGVVGVAALAVLGTGIVTVIGVPQRGGPAPGSPGSALGSQALTPATAPQVRPAPASGTPATPEPTVPSAVPVGATTAPAPVGTTTAPDPTVPPTSASPTLPVTPGALTASPTTVILVRPGKGYPPAGAFTLTANGGPTAFAITIPAAHAGDLTLTPLTGSLAAGQSVQVSVTLRKGYGGRLDTQLSVQPGGLAVTVVYRVPSSD